MANKKLLYLSGSIVRELPSGSSATASYYDDTTNFIVTKAILFDTASFQGTQYGLPTVSASLVGIKAAQGFDVIAWNPNYYGIGKGGWDLMPGRDIDLSSGGPYTASSNSDVSGNMSTEPKVVSLANVSTGNSLQVINGGTGLAINDLQSINEVLLLGNDLNKLKLTLTASAQNNTKKALYINNSTWDYIDRNDNTVTSSIEVSVYTSSAIWNKPSNTKIVRVLAQGAGGGGGAGANRTAGVNARVLGGSGGSSGGFVEFSFLLDDSITGSIITVGTGGVGGSIQSVANSGTNGADGGNSSFGDFIYAFGGKGGFGGTYSTTVATTITGGAAVSGSSTTYDSALYNSLNRVTSSIAGGSATGTDGSSVAFVATNYYVSAGGGGAGAISGSTAYAGGNGGTNNFNSGTVANPNATNAISSSITSSIGITLLEFSNSQVNDVFISCGGGGGAASTTSIGGFGGSGSWGSGGGGGGGSTGAVSGTVQGGRGGDGYIAVISYKF